MKVFSTKAITLAIVLASAGLASNAQEGVNLSLSNNSFNIAGKLTGLPELNYLYPDWHKGSVKLSDDKVYRGLDLTYDLINERVLFRSADLSAQAFKLPVKEFTIVNPDEEKGLINKVFRNGFNALDGHKESTFYEILSDGEIKLLKNIQLKRVDEPEIGSIYSTKKLVKVETYFVFNNGELKKVKRDKK